MKKRCMYNSTWHSTQHSELNSKSYTLLYVDFSHIIYNYKNSDVITVKTNNGKKNLCINKPSRN